MLPVLIMAYILPILPTLTFWRTYLSYVAYVDNIACVDTPE